MEQIIFNNNILELPNIFKIELKNDICNVIDIYFTFDDKKKVKEFFNVLDKLCSQYNINICYILVDPKYILNNVIIDYSLYCTFKYNDNVFIKNNFCPCNDNQNYDIYNKDLVYSVGEEDYKHLSYISLFLKQKKILDFYLMVKENIDIKEENLIRSLNFNMTLEDCLKSQEHSNIMSDFLYKNNLVFINYIKIK